MSEEALDLRGTFRAVVDVLAEIGLPHAFIGALPVLAWGRVRATTDLDVVVLVGAKWSRLDAALRGRGLEPTRQIGPVDRDDALPDIAVFQAPSRRSPRVDLFVAKTEFERAVIESAREAQVLGLTVKLARPEASIVYKLIARRRKDLDDVDSLFEARAAAGEKLDWEFLDRWAAAWGITDVLRPYRERFAPDSERR